jgi:Zn-dependent protease
MNPLVHIDPIGLLVLFVTRMFGWAKPVPVNVSNLSPQRLGSISVSLAGPMSNLALAVIFACGYKLLFSVGGLLGPQHVGTLMALVQRTVIAGMAMNVGLMVFNLIPIYPLDGHHILREMLPAQHRPGFMQWQMRYGMYALIGVLIMLRMSPVSPAGWVIGIMIKVFGL